MLAEFAVGQVLLSMIWFFLFFMWMMMLFHVITDIFRSSDLSGFAKVMWFVLVIIFPFLGVFLYVIIRSKNMAQHEDDDKAAQRAAIQQIAGGGQPSAAQELERLAELRTNGLIDDAEFASLKAKALAG